MKRNPIFQQGFTLIEVIVTLSVLSIVAGIVAMLLKTPVQGYMESARHAEMSDIADTALTRIRNDLRLALPNSVRVQTASGTACNGAANASCYFLEFIPVLDGGRYCPVSGVCDSPVLSAASSVGSFDVFGAMPAFSAASSVVVDNLGTTGHSAYTATDSSYWQSTSASSVSLSSPFPSTTDSPNDSFYAIATPVSYVCVLPANGAGTLTRYWGYSIQATQPDTVPIAGASSALLASNISACNFTAPPVNMTTPGVATMQLTITENGESISLYGEVSVGNVP
jgi:MSHA biogenesis protein MshO